MLSSCSTESSAAGAPSGSASSNQTVLPRGVRRDPQAALSSPTSCSPRPPSSVSRARPAARLDETRVPHLADERTVAEQPEPDLALAVAQGVGDELADEQFGGVHQVVQIPGGELFAGQLAGAADRAELAREAPVAHRVRGEPLDTGHQQGDVVLAVPGVEGRQDVVADVFEGLRRFGEGLPEGVEALVERVVAGLDEPVGVQREEGALLELHLDLLEGLAADAERHARRDVEQQGGLARLGDDRGR